MLTTPSQLVQEVVCFLECFQPRFFGPFWAALQMGHTTKFVLNLCFVCYSLMVVAFIQFVLVRSFKVSNDCFFLRWLSLETIS